MIDPKVPAISLLSMITIEVFKQMSDATVSVLQIMVAVLTIIYLIKKIKQKTK